MLVSVDKLVEGLREIPDDQFTCDNVYDFLGRTPVDIDTIAPFVHWSSKFYTRNLIYKDPRFEVMAICWEKGQASRVHDHADQKCWMMVASGRLRGQNFRIVEQDVEAGYCKLEPTSRFDLSDCLAAKVELEEPIHQVINEAEFDERAVSLHIYSKPYDSCLSFCLETDRFQKVPLFYASIGGRLCDGVSL